jgi:pilus assembly protein CpaB
MGQMNRNRLIIGMAAAVVVAFFISAFVYRELQRANTMHPLETQQIVVAAEPLQLGSRIDASNLRTISWPAGDSISGSFAKVSDCTGRAVIKPVAENEPILEANLAPTGAGAGLPATIPEGMRAVSVAVNDVVGVAGFVVPGTTVDVLVTGTVANGRGENVTRTILEDVPVLAAGQKIQQDRAGKPQTVPVVTLLVSPEDADKLTMASTEGKIQLALRNTIDTQTMNPAPVLQNALFSGPEPPPLKARVRRPVAKPSPYEVEVITGTKKVTRTFEDQQ